MEETPKKKRKRREPTKAAPYGYTKDGVPKVRVSKKMAANGIKVVKRTTKLQRREKQGYLKYFQIVMQWACKEHDLLMSDVECLLFLYDEDVFTSRDIKKYSILVKIDDRRLRKLRDKGLVSSIPSRDKRGSMVIYELTHRGKKFCNSIYKKMNMEEDISEAKLINNIAKKTHAYSSSYVASVNRFNEIFNEMRNEAIIAAAKRREENAAKRRGRNNAWDGSYGQ